MARPGPGWSGSRGRSPAPDLNRSRAGAGSACGEPDFPISPCRARRSTAPGRGSVRAAFACGAPGGSPARDRAGIGIQASVISTTSGRQRKRTGGRDGADAAGDEDLGARALDQAVEVLLAVPRGDDRGAEAGHDDLPAVGVSAQHQPDAGVADRPRRSRGCATGGARRRPSVASPRAASRSCTSVQRSPTPADPQPGAAALEPDAGVVQVGELRLGQRGPRDRARTRGCRGCPAPRTGPCGPPACPARRSPARCSRPTGACSRRPAGRCRAAARWSSRRRAGCRPAGQMARGARRPAARRSSPGTAAAGSAPRSSAAATRHHLASRNG